MFNQEQIYCDKLFQGLILKLLNVTGNRKLPTWLMKLIECLHALPWISRQTGHRG